jgi:hypothetical protein
MALSGDMPFEAKTDRVTLELVINSKEEVARKDIVLFLTLCSNNEYRRHCCSLLATRA